MKNDKKTIVVNLYGGPGSGKSTLMASIFSELKLNGINCEMAPEFAKEKVWEGSLDILANQLYIFGKQHHTIFRLLGKVDVIITDSPIILSLYYGKNCSNTFKKLVLEEYAKLNNINFFVDRIKKYNPKGRLQTESEAKQIDKELLSILSKNNIHAVHVEGGRKNIKWISKSIIDIIKKEII